MPWPPISSLDAFYYLVHFNRICAKAKTEVNSHTEEVFITNVYNNEHPNQLRCVS